MRVWLQWQDIPLPHEFILNKSLMADLYPSFAEGLKPFFTLNWGVYATSSPSRVV
jgi:photosystem I P700 chlorophyll a apoprotein A1